MASELLRAAVPFCPVFSRLPHLAVPPAPEGSGCVSRVPRRRSTPAVSFLVPGVVRAVPASAYHPPHPPERLFSDASTPHSSSSQPSFSFEEQVLRRPRVRVHKISCCQGRCPLTMWSWASETKECSLLDWPEKALYTNVVLKNYRNAMALSKNSPVTLRRSDWKA